MKEREKEAKWTHRYITLQKQSFNQRPKWSAKRGASIEREMCRLFKRESKREIEGKEMRVIR